MPGSNPETKPWIVNKVISNNLLESSILDVGPGFGTYADVLHQNGFVGKIDAVEVWNPYIQKYSLNTKYKNVFNDDIRNWNDFNYDLIIYGDVLEHVSKDDAIEIWNKTSKYAKYAVIAIPIIHYPQGEYDGNPYEAHIKDDWSHEEMISTFNFINDYFIGTETGAYWAEFENK